MKRYTLLICLLAVMGWGSVHAQENGDVWFERANAAYNEGNYDSAMMLYEKILALDVESVPSISIWATPIIKCVSTPWQSTVLRKP